METKNLDQFAQNGVFTITTKLSHCFPSCTVFYSLFQVIPKKSRYKMQGPAFCFYNYHLHQSYKTGWQFMKSPKNSQKYFQNGITPKHMVLGFWKLLHYKSGGRQGPLDSTDSCCRREDSPPMFRRGDESPDGYTMMYAIYIFKYIYIYIWSKEV